METHISSIEIHNKFAKIWQENIEFYSEQKLNSKYEKLSQIFGDFATINNHFISIFNTKSQRVLFMNDNLKEVLGYSCSTDDYKKWSSVYWLRDMPYQQSWFFILQSWFYRKTIQPILKNAGSEANMNWFLHNLKIKAPNSIVKHVSIKCSALEIGSKGEITIILTIIKDISSLIKDKNIWWAEFNANGNTKFKFLPDHKKFEQGGFLSEREMEILKLIASNNDSKTIADILKISLHTVEKHRKNVIEKTGAKDSSCLIQLLEFANIL